MENNIIIELKNVSKEFDGVTVVDDFSLQIKKGEFVTFLGPSGCGKTTTLRMIGGFELPTGGEILLHGQDISTLPPFKRPVNTIFQRYALFQHLDVYDNIAFGLRVKKFPFSEKDGLGNEHSYLRKLTASEIDEKVLNALKVVDLEDFENRDVTTLSGGQQQRVAIARAIVNDPEILLLDEPLGALDLKMRKEMQIELKEMHRKLGITFIYVTHDQEEALTMSDTIVVMNAGKILQVGKPVDIYNEPSNAFVANFIGESNIYNGTIVGENKIRFLNKVFPADTHLPINELVDVIIRPEDFIIGKENEGIVNGVIENIIFKGVHYEYIVAVGKSDAVVSDTRLYKVNQKISLNVEQENIHIMKKELTINKYMDAWINDKNELVIDELIFPVDITKLIPGSSLTEEGYLLNAKGVKYDLNDYDVTASIPFDAIDLTVNPEEGQFTAEVITCLWKGDHYQIMVRTPLDEEDFVLTNEYDYEVGTEVGVTVDVSKILLSPRGNLSEKEV